MQAKSIKGMGRGNSEAKGAINPPILPMRLHKPILEVTTSEENMSKLA